MFEFKIQARDKKTKARAGEFLTPHGKLTTPQFAFVATEGKVKGIPKDILPQLPIHYLVVNTFHTYVKNIIPKIEKEGGVHRYLNYKNITATDSGGFQVFSLGFGKLHNIGKIGGLFPGKKHESLDKNNPITISEEGASFTFDNQTLALTPEKSIELQARISADILFAFDECTSPLNSKTYTKKAMERTHRWLIRCINTYKKQTLDDRVSKLDSEASKSKIKKNQPSNFQSQNPASSFQHQASRLQALFGVVQGGYFKDLRNSSAKYMAKLDVPGFGIGGSLGTTKDEVRSVLEWTIPYLPEEKPRHLLGIGQVRDIFEAVERGVDLFDCVIPTREARHKVLYTKHGRINIKKHTNENIILEKGCKCISCQEKLTYRQLVQLFQLRDPRAFLFSTAHNIQFYADLMNNIRSSIEKNEFLKLKATYFNSY